MSAISISLGLLLSVGGLIGLIQGNMSLIEFLVMYVIGAVFIVNGAGWIFHGKISKPKQKAPPS